MTTGSWTPRGRRQRLACGGERDCKGHHSCVTCSTRPHAATLTHPGPLPTRRGPVHLGFTQVRSAVSPSPPSTRPVLLPFSRVFPPHSGPGLCITRSSLSTLPVPPTEPRRDRGFSLLRPLLHPHGFERCLASSRCPVNICRMSESMFGTCCARGWTAIGPDALDANVVQIRSQGLAAPCSTPGAGDEPNGGGGQSWAPWALSARGRYASWQLHRASVWDRWDQRVRLSWSASSQAHGDSAWAPPPPLPLGRSVCLSSRARLPASGIGPALWWGAGGAAWIITKLPASGRMFTDYSSNSDSSKCPASLTIQKFCDITVLFRFGVSFMQSYINHFSLDVSLRMALLSPEL